MSFSIRTLPKLKLSKNNNVTERKKYNDDICKLNYCTSNEKIRYDHKDLKQLISTVHDQQEVIGTMMKTISDQQKDSSESTKRMVEQQKKIFDQQKTIHRLLMPVDSQIISGTKTTFSTINDTTKITSTATTTTTNINRITGHMCRQKNVTDKNDQRLKTRTIANNTKRKRE